MIRRREINKEIVYDILGFDYEEDMITICDKLSNKLKVTITDKLNGPGTIIWKLIIENSHIFLVNNSWGNFLRPDNDTARQFLEKEFELFNEIL